MSQQDALALSASSSTPGRLPDLRLLSGDDPHTQLVSSLRSQITDLMNQVTQLNGKLVQSYDRVSDLEDALHLTASNLRSSTIQISQLEIERAQHLAALNTGLLVEKSSITAELTRLMERVSEETAQRGEAEDAKTAIEKDLDDLSATLFAQANTMVAEARYSRSLSERKAEDAEKALKSAEEAVSLLQIQMQTLCEQKEKSESEAKALRQICGASGTAVMMSLQVNDAAPLLPRLSTTHPSYHEFLMFVSHIRLIRSGGGHSPQMSTLLGLPFLSRLIAEESEPTLRLEAAPALNWLTRRNVQTAIYCGQLSIEPMSTQRLQLDPTVISTVAALSSLHDITCSICGKYIYPDPSTPPKSRPSRLMHQTSASWASTSRFLKQQLSSTPASPSSPVSPPPSFISPQTFVFRLSLPQSQTSVSYPLCHDGYCLVRLRSTCDLWHFLTKNVVEQIWNEPDGPKMAASQRQASSSSDLPLSLTHPVNGTLQPGMPPRRNVASRVGNLWGKGLGALGFDKSPSRSSTPPLPAEGSLSHLGPAPRRVPPPPPPSAERAAAKHVATTPEIPHTTPAPPVLPPRRHPINSATVSEQIPSSETYQDSHAQSSENGDEVPDSSKPSSHPSSRKDEPVETVGNSDVSGLHTSPQTPITDGFITPPETNITLSPVASSEASTLATDTVVPDSETRDEAVIQDSVEGTSLTGQATGHSEPEVLAVDKPRTPSPSSPGKAPQELPTRAAGTPPPLPRRAAARERSKSILKTSEPSSLSSRTGSPIPRAHSPSISELKASETLVEEIKPTEHAAPDAEAVKREECTVVDANPMPTSKGNEISRASTESESILVVPPKVPPRRASGKFAPPAARPAREDNNVLVSSIEDESSPVVGDETWEDRQWKELVKLREVMFWARIGGQRSANSS
ncbi:uncharacterized protein EI90DRAFT_3126387 [Cantharellus anzutake]|uniref:uncharacterized protein n=1 Tax=Cantharellus anzutake TaxID=1750568 RepID=UPI0019031C4A|nr:uncharacterized protein EI90DRAFT_3126387 [Cantharellus anzutake]KAF8328216.1 hypothetical protein EI90DRAFT_3126387 [Cantharellus anzutake]